MKRVCFAVMGGLLLMSAPVFSAQVWAQQAVSLHARTTGDLAEMCGTDPTKPAADAKINYCHGFAQGAVDVRLRAAGDKKPFCFPSPAPTRSVTLKEFVGWVRAAPASRDTPALDGLFKFLGERFPCK